MPAGSLFRVGVGAIPFLLPLMLQLGFGLTRGAERPRHLRQRRRRHRHEARRPVRAARLRLPQDAGLERHRSAPCCWRCGLRSAPAGRSALLYAALIVGGFLRSLQFTAYNTIAYADIPRDRMSAATSLYSTMQQLSLTLGITVGAAALQFATLVSGRTGPSLSDFTVAFLTVALFSLVAAPFAFRLPDSAGAEMSGHRGRRGA